MDGQQMDREQTIYRLDDVAEELRFGVVPALAALEAALTNMSDENEADGEGGIADQLGGVRALACRTLEKLRKQANRIWQITQASSDLAIDVYERTALAMEGKSFDEKIVIWRRIREALGEPVTE